MTGSKLTMTSEETELLHRLHVAGGRKNLPASQYYLGYDRLEHAGLVTTAAAGVDVVVVRLTSKGRAIAQQPS